MTYGFKERAQFEEARREILDGSLDIAGNPDKYRRTMSCGLGLWMDAVAPSLPQLSVVNETANPDGCDSSFSPWLR